MRRHHCFLRTETELRDTKKCTKVASVGTKCTSLSHAATDTAGAGAQTPVRSETRGWGRAGGRGASRMYTRSEQRWSLTWLRRDTQGREKGTVPLPGRGWPRAPVQTRTTRFFCLELPKHPRTHPAREVSVWLYRGHGAGGIARRLLGARVSFPCSRRVPFRSLSSLAPPVAGNRGDGEQPGASLPL